MEESNKSPLQNGSAKSKEQKNFDEILHKLLIIGLSLSVVFMLTGLFLSWGEHQSIPTVIPEIGIIFSQVATLTPAGFIGLGLLVLIATPIIRVFCSIIAFVVERDWRFAGITLIVLITVMISVLLGKE